ncbi:MAG TPA: hypothetical protein VH482_14335 [Thermomicrobiales bacterium]
MFCTTCASINARNARRCSACGGPLRDAPPESARIRRRPSRVVPRRALRIIQALPILLLAAGFALAADHAWTARADRAVAYAAADRAMAQGDLVAARDGFARLGTYRDADRRLSEATVALAPYQSAVEDARAAAAQNRFADAIAGLLAVVHDLPTYAPAVSLLADVRAQQRQQLEADAAAAERTGDWLAVERSLAALAAGNPTDQGVASHLAAVRRQHAPFVYARDGVVYLASPDGDERALTPSMDASWPSWNPTRTQIAFIQRHPNGAALDGTLCVIDLDGANLRTLAERVMPFSWPSWSPDGTKIAFASAVNFDETRNDGQIALHVVDLNTGLETDLTGDRLPHADSPSWSPDGSAIAFVSFRFQRRRDGSIRRADGETYVVDVATRALTDVSQGRITDEAWVSWSPVDDRLLIFTVPDDWSNPQQSQIYLLDLATTGLTEIPTHAWELSRPYWSPDGRHFAYVEGNNVVRIWSASGEDWIRVDSDLAPFISWSIDGSALFVASDALYAPSYVLPVDDQFGARTPLTVAYDASGNNGPPQWSPRTLPPSPRSPSLTGTALDP